MKYSIESTDNGCIETIELSNGKKYVKNHTIVPGGTKQEDDNFSEQMEKDGIDDGIFLDLVDNYFDGFLAHHFIDIARQYVS